MSKHKSEVKQKSFEIWWINCWN